MPNHVLQIDCSGGITGVEAELDVAPYAGPYGTVWIEADFAFNSIYLAALLGGVAKDEPLQLGDTFGSSHSEEILVDPAGTGGWTTFGASGATFGGAPSGGVLADTLVPLQFYRLKLRLTAGTPATANAWIDGFSLGPITMTGIDIGSLVFVEVQAGIVATAGALAYFDNVKVGTTEGASDILSDDFEGVGAPSASIWNSFIDAAVVADPGITPPTVGGGGSLAASFTGSPTSGSSPLTVNFTDTSTPGPSGPIRAWDWDFGDGGTSALRNPTHVYATTGTYTVILTVTGTRPDGKDTAVRYAYITTDGGGGGGGGTGGAPIAAFTAIPRIGSRLNVTFTDYSAAGTSGPITAWHWTFGDGLTSTTQSPVHAYTTPGVYSVTLTVTGTGPDGTDTVTKAAFITVLVPTPAGPKISIYDLGTTVLADISGIALERSFTRQLNAASSFTVTAPANSTLLTEIADDGFPILYDGGNRKLVVWENDADPETDDPLFHGRIFTVERSGDENAARVMFTAYDPRMELGYEADDRAGRVVRDNTATTFGDPSFLTPVFSPTPTQDGISGPDLIQQILTYSQMDPSTNPIQGEGPLPIDVISGTWDLDVPPAIDMNPVDSADWPVLVGDFINQLIATDAVDFDLRPVRPGTGRNVDGDLDDYIMCEASSVSKMGTDRSATVHFDYLTGSHNAKAARQECDFSLHCDRLWYELGPRIDKQHWRGDITPHGDFSSTHGLLELMDDSADKYGGPDALKGYNASIRIFDSLGTENSSRPLYQALYQAEIKWRVEPRRLLYITPNPDAKALFQPPEDYDVYDLIRIRTGAGFGVVLDEKQRVHGYTKTWTREGVAVVSELLAGPDAADSPFSTPAEAPPLTADFVVGG